MVRTVQILPTSPFPPSRLLTTQISCKGSNIRTKLKQPMESRKVFLHPRVRSLRQDTLPQKYHLQSPASQNNTPFKNRKSSHTLHNKHPNNTPFLNKAPSFPKTKKTYKPGYPSLLTTRKQIKSNHRDEPSHHITSHDILFEIEKRTTFARLSLRGCAIIDGARHT